MFEFVLGGDGKGGRGGNSCIDVSSVNGSRAVKGGGVRVVTLSV